MFNDNLLINWSWVKLGDVCKIIMGQSPPSSTYNTKQIGLPFFQGKTEFTELYPKVIKWCSEPGKIAEPLDILISVRAPVGSTNIANQKCSIGRGLSAIRYPDCPKFIFYYFRLVEKDLDKLGTGTTFRAISSKTLNDFPIAIPSLFEQKKIVAKIEELFSELDSGVASLRIAKEKIKTYRKSILSYAFSGKLTGEVKGETVKDGLPPGWEWVKLGMVIELLQYGTSDKATHDKEGVPVLRMGNIQDGKIDFTNLKYFPNDYSDKEKYLLEDDDILFNRTNSAELVGKSAVYKSGDLKSIFASYLIRVKVKKEIYSASFLNYYINSSFGREYFKCVVSQNVGQANVNGTKLKSLPILLMPIKNQQQIVSEIERRFSVADKLEQTIDESLKKAEALKQSILKKAFEGKLLKEEKDLTAFQLMQIVGAIIKNLEEYNIHKGEMIIAKYLYLLQKLYKIKIGLIYDRRHFGPYTPRLKKLLTSPQGFFQKIGKGTESYYSLKKKEQLFKYYNKIMNDVNDQFPKLIELFSKYKNHNQRDHKIELLATVSKLIEDFNTIDHQLIYEKMTEWKTDKKVTGFYNKAEKFAKEETVKCISFIQKNNWDKILLEKI